MAINSAANGRWLVTANIMSALQTTGSVSWWMSTTQTGSDTPWSAPAICGIEQNGGLNDAFWGGITLSGEVEIMFHGGSQLEGATVINDGNLRHFVSTWNSTTGAAALFVNGVSDVSGTAGTGDVVGFTTDRIMKLTSPWGESLIGTVIDFRVYNRVLTLPEVQAIYTQQGRDSITYGIVHRFPMLERSPGTVVSGTGVVRDIGSNQNNASNNGAPTWEEQDIGFRRRRAS